VSTLPHEGDVVDGKYRIERLIGEGAMGCVYRAHHLVLGHSVAIKLLREAAETEEVRTRFVREGRATMALRSDHVVRVFDMGVLPSSTPYMVLELLEGTDLRSLLSTRGALEVPEAVDYVLQVCEALAEAHLNGIVHRDIKPQNLFLTRRPNGAPCVKLLDFGVSKMEERSPSSHELTMSQVMLGSPVFASPEQIRDSSKVDARTDVWSLAVVLYMLVGGGRPFDGADLPALCASIMVDAPRPLSSRCPAVPTELEAVIFRGFEKSREKRTPNVAELARQLAPFATSQGRVSAERVLHVYPASSSIAVAPSNALPIQPATATNPTSKDLSSTVTSVEGTAIDPPLSARPSDEDPRPAPRAIRRWPLALVGLGMLVGGSLLLARATSHENAETSAAPAASAVTVATSASSTALEIVHAPAAEPSQTPPTPPSSFVSAAHATSPQTGARTKPSAVPPKKKGQVDRNGLPILD
jgi:serine/threonine-protein kinase